MKNKVIFSITLCIVFILSLSFKSLANKTYTQEKNNSNEILFQNKSVNTHNKIDVFGNIIKSLKGRTVEYGIMVQFDSRSDRRKTVDELFNKINRYGKLSRKTSSNNESYSIELQGNSINGFIESTQYDDHNIVKIDIVKKDNKYMIQQLENNLDKILGSELENVRMYRYIKIEMENNNIDETYKKVTNVLKIIGVNRINTEAIENGYTSTAYTGQYEKIYSNGAPIDFNFAVVEYSTGTYLIMGTPEIMETY
ncbi:hypothetical protein KM803_03615 [Clostridium tyrobutyricum]|uniref:hypothetical protein n=1 Tax=Clostridium tyrobutyricum TaxID=1519 RepID=UPI001C38B320|nr:hypothetical protein [Clostridium tyrobutyricum]MBV4430424.1 hypothetical protein [Clostridium tyrobutyricum]